MLKIVKDEEPFVVDVLTETLEIAKTEKIRALCMVYMIGDRVYTDYVKGDGTPLTEMIGCVEIARTELVEAMRR